MRSSVISFRLAVFLLGALATILFAPLHAEEGPDEPDASATAKSKKHVKRQAKHADRDAIALLKSTLNLDASRIGSTIDRPTRSGLEIIKALQQMPGEQIRTEIIPAMEKELLDSLRKDYEGKTSVSGRLLNLITALGALGEPGFPSLKKAYGHDPMIDLFLTRKLGPAARPYLKGLLDNPVQDEFWLTYYVASLAGPGKEVVPQLIDAIKRDEKSVGKYVSMVLDRIGPECVPQVAELLNDADWFNRWSAAKAFEMMGPKARTVLPALEKHLRNPDEDLDVRIAVARAIASIRGVRPEHLYATIPNLESQLVEATHAKSLTRRIWLLSNAEASGINTHISGWAHTAWLVAAFTKGNTYPRPIYQFGLSWKRAGMVPRPATSCGFS